MSLQGFLRGLRFLVAAGLLGWTVWLFVEHQDLHDRGCLTESAWTTQNDEIYDRELKVE
ncbi:putative conserved membrane protein [Synechococcus sp. TAK9802]|nr:putative conserved membrane protein [Synechococcus sp. TAK9802]